MKISEFTTAGALFLFLSIKEKKVKLSQFGKQDKSRAKRVCAHFNTMCTDEEHKILEDPDVESQVKKKILTQVKDYIVLRFKDSFRRVKTVGNKIPIIVDDDSEKNQKYRRNFKASTLETLISELRKKKLTVVPDPEEFQLFRYRIDHPDNDDDE